MIQDAPLSEILAALERLEKLALRVREIEADEWLTAVEAAEYLNIGGAVFRRLAADGKVPRHKISGEYRYHKAELLRWALER